MDENAHFLFEMATALSTQLKDAEKKAGLRVPVRSHLGAHYNKMRAQFVEMYPDAQSTAPPVVAISDGMTLASYTELGVYSTQILETLKRKQRRTGTILG